jgi:midasin (ATPase involved in ribosome maturation)
MPKSPALEQKDFARTALIEATSKSKVGNFIEVIDEGENVASYLFENNQKGYVGWRWSVTIFQANSKEPATVSEIVLMPGPDSLVAPDWVPWSERLADYKALQLELEKQAALEAEEAEESDDDADLDVEEDEADDLDVDDDESESNDLESESVEIRSAEQPAESESAVSDLEEGEDSENDSENTGRKPPRFLRRRKGFKIKKARGKGKNPQD